MNRSQARRLKAGSLIFLITSLLTVQLHSFGVFDRLEWISYDHRQSYFRSDKAAHDDIAIILIDESSLQALAPVAGRFPWPRSIYSDLLEFLSYGEPRAILFDILFTESQNADNQNQDDDLSFAMSTASLGNVFHASQIMSVADDEIGDKTLNRPLPEDFIEQFDLKLTIGTNDLATNSYTLPYPTLYQGAAGIASVDMSPEQDGVYRNVYPFRFYQGIALPGLGFAPFSWQTTLNKTDTNITIGNSTIPLLDDGRYPVNMAGKFNTYSFAGLLASLNQIRSGDVENLIVNPEEFADKIVFIGASAVGLEDIKATPVLYQTPGVMIHASVASNILENDFLAPPPPGLKYSSILVLALISTLSVLAFKNFLLQVSLPIAITSAYALICYVLFNNNQIITLVAPVFSSTIAAAAALSFLAMTEGKDKQRVRKMLSQYVSPAILTEMVDKTDELAKADIGSVETLTILFSDVRGFTSISENLNATEVVELLNIHLGAMSDVIFKYRGTLDKFIGDAIMAFWGAPIKSEHHANEAVESALAMVRELRNVNKQLKEKGYKSIKVGIGLHTGDVVLGNIGSSKKLDYTIIGDNVNLASRMEGLTKNYHCEVLITEDTVKALTTEIPCLKVDVVRVKGKKHPTSVYIPFDTSIMSEKEVDLTWDYHRISDQAFQKYLNREWMDAIALFEQLPEIPAIIDMIMRCEHYKTSPPPKDWDGVHTMTTK
ncbi:CHASE2 domain-containing protein [Oceanospirillum sanctuarii]|uniref:CHASE2 domain-containing protein n=1 Tax=Oceanospirillum sanctuarii TaxID=1434821 RepID=UPI000A3C39B1|nr:adenylate/guanylate cyclase domain-containing protein [Oceanospirillum sanctuarii]